MITALILLLLYIIGSCALVAWILYRYPRGKSIWLNVTLAPVVLPYSVALAFYDTIKSHSKEDRLMADKRGDGTTRPPPDKP